MKMKMRNYVLCMAMILLVLGSIAPAAVLSSAETWFAIKNINSYGAEGLEIVSGGSVVAEARVNQDSVTPITVPSKLTLSGGTFYSKIDYKFPNSSAPVEMWINSGEFKANKLQHLGGLPSKPNHSPAVIHIGGGSLIILSYYDPDPAYQVQWNPAAWADRGVLVAQEGYELAFEDLGPTAEPGLPGRAVRVYGLGGVASNPIPAHNSTVSDLNLAQLTWSSRMSEISKVYFGKSNDANSYNYQTKLTYLGKTGILDPDGQTVNYSLVGKITTPLDVPATYSWAVAGYTELGGEPNQLLGVMVFKFNTSSLPSIATQPTGQYKNAGETAVFTTVVGSVTALTSARWYKNGSYLQDGVVTGLGANQYQVGLTVTNAQIANQGSYYCIAANSAGSIQTDTVYLVIKRMLAHWNFNGNVNDETGVYNGEPNVLPANYTTEGVHQGLVFDGARQFVTLPSGFDNFKAGMSIAVMARMDTDAGTSVRYYDFAQSQAVPADPLNSINFTRVGSTTDELAFRAATNTNFAGSLALGTWQHFVVTMNASGIVNMYRDGFLFGTSSNTAPAVVIRNLNFIGRQNPALAVPPATEGARFKGMMDDMRIYNYEISADDVANLYSGIAGPYCRSYPAMDWDHSCKVDLADFATFAQNWLDCGVWPESACSTW